MKRLLKLTMKKNILILAIAIFIFACDGEVKVNEQKLDSAGAKLQEAVGEGVDTVRAKLDRLEDRLDKNDSTND